MSVKSLNTAFSFDGTTPPSASPYSLSSPDEKTPHSAGVTSLKRSGHRRESTVDLTARNAAIKALASQAGHYIGAEVKIDTAIANLLIGDKKLINPCPLKNIAGAFDEVRAKYAPEPPCCGCCDLGGLVNATLEGLIAYNTASLGPLGASLAGGLRSRAESWWEAVTSSNKAEKINTFSSLCQQLCEQLQKQYEVIGNNIQTRYLNAKHGFNLNEPIQEVVDLAQSLHNNLKNIEGVIDSKLGIVKRGTNHVEGKKILLPFKQNLEIILYENSKFQGPIDAEKYALFKKEDTALYNKKEYHESQQKQHEAQQQLIETQQKELIELRMNINDLRRRMDSFKPLTPVMERGPSVAVIAAGAVMPNVAQNGNLTSQANSDSGRKRASSESNASGLAASATAGVTLAVLSQSSASGLTDALASSGSMTLISTPSLVAPSESSASGLASSATAGVTLAVLSQSSSSGLTDASASTGSMTSISTPSLAAPSESSASGLTASATAGVTLAVLSQSSSSGLTDALASSGSMTSISTESSAAQDKLFKALTTFGSLMTSVSSVRSSGIALSPPSSPRRFEPLTPAVSAPGREPQPTPSNNLSIVSAAGKLSLTPLIAPTPSPIASPSPIVSNSSADSENLYSSDVASYTLQSSESDPILPSTFRLRLTKRPLALEKEQSIRRRTAQVKKNGKTHWRP